jgi:hypothetical protein
VRIIVEEQNGEIVQILAGKREASWTWKTDTEIPAGDLEEINDVAKRIVLSHHGANEDRLYDEWKDSQLAEAKSGTN